MRFINVGTKINGIRPKTKKQLKEAMQGAASTVTFDTTSPFDGYATYRGDDVPEGVTLNVVGPDPFTKRSWYANVTRTTCS